MTYTFKVTKKDIQTGVSYDVCNCPVARCMTRTLKMPWAVGIRYAWLQKVNTKPVLLPKEVYQKLYLGLTKRSKPFTFTLEIPAKSMNRSHVQRHQNSILLKSPVNRPKRKVNLFQP